MSLPIDPEFAGTTQALFYEFRHQTKRPLDKIPYNLKDVDWKGTKSMYQIYMSCDTEYDAAIAILGSWNHWLKLKGAPWFMEHLEKWDEERRIRDEALARRTLLDQAEQGSVTAARAILDGNKGSKGRPKNKEEVKEDPSEIDSLLDRGLRVINGNKE